MRITSTRVSSESNSKQTNQSSMYLHIFLYPFLLDLFMLFIFSLSPNLQLVTADGCPALSLLRWSFNRSLPVRIECFLPTTAKHLLMRFSLLAVCITRVIHPHMHGQQHRQQKSIIRPNEETNKEFTQHYGR